MVAIADARNAIYTYFLANFTGVPAARIDAANEEFDTPVGVPWVRLSVNHNFATQRSLGGAGQRKYDRGGTVFVQIFTPQNAGLNSADDIVQDVIDTLEGIHLQNNDIRLNTATPNEIGLTDGWHLLLVSIDFEYTENR